jgi:phosphoribosylanthranilate isomerase
MKVTVGVTGRLVVKICGMRSTESALAAARAGADLLGFNFAPVSKRRVEVALAKEAIATVREVATPAMVGVFVDQALTEIAEVARACRLDAVQLSGAESVAACREVAAETGLPVFKAVRLAGLQALDEAARYAGAGGVAALLVDAPVAGAWGGTGQSWDWGRAAPLARRFPVLLAGGLQPDNVGAAVAAVNPWGVDVASGVESAGWTDPARVVDFIAVARAAPMREQRGHRQTEER